MSELEKAVKEWMALAPQVVVDALGLVTVQNFLRDEANRSWQMAGAYDGAMDEECKASFRRRSQVLLTMREEIRHRYQPAAGASDE